MRPSSLAQEIKSKYLISSVVKRTVTLKGRGPNFLGLCPFHQEKTPSFHVRDQEGRFKCFGCGVFGDVFEFLKLLRGLSFREAVDELAIGLGIKVENTPAHSANPGNSSQLLRAQRVAHKFFMNELASPRGESARAYLIEKRKLTPKMIQQAGLGFLGNNAKALFSYLKENNIGRNLAERAGLIKTSYGEMTPQFSDRIIFPIRNLEGQVLAFGARIFLSKDQGLPKYINTHAYEHYEKRKILYGLFESKTAINKGQTPVLVEGYFDAMAVWACGFPALSLCGTALSNEHARLLKKLSSNLILCLDSDDAGTNAVIASLQDLFSVGLSSRVALLDKNDPGNYLEENKTHQLIELIESHHDAFSHVIKYLCARTGNDILLRLKVIDQLKPIFLSIERAIVRRQYVTLFANCLHEEPSVLWAELGSKINLQWKAKTEITSVSRKFSSSDRLTWQIISSCPSLCKEIDDDIHKMISPSFSRLIRALALDGGPISDSFGAYALSVAHNMGIDLESGLKGMGLDGFKLSKEEAGKMLLGLREKALKMKGLELINNNRVQLLAFEKNKDFSSVVKTLKEQSEFLAIRNKKRQVGIYKRPGEIKAKGLEVPDIKVKTSLPKTLSKSFETREETPIFDNEDDWF